MRECENKKKDNKLREREREKEGANESKRRAHLDKWRMASLWEGEERERD